MEQPLVPHDPTIADDVDRAPGQEPDPPLQESGIPGEVPLPEPAAPRSEAPRSSEVRRRLAGLSPLGAVLILALISAFAYLFSPWLTQEVRLGWQPTASPPVTIPVPTEAIALRVPAESPPETPLSPGEIVERLAEARDLAQQGSLEDAALLYEDLARQAPDDARPEAGWARVLLLDRQSEAALAHARHAMERDPISAEATSVLARAYLASGEADRALAMAQSAVELGPSSAEAHATLADAYRLTGRLQEAVVEADRALAQDSNNAEAHRIRGWLYDAVEGDAALALAELQVAVDLEPELWMRHSDLGRILLKAGEYEAALTALERALALRPEAEVLTPLAEAYYRLDQYGRARAALEQALSAGAAEADTYALFAAIQAQQGRCDDAEHYLELAMAEEPAHPLVLEARAICGGVSPMPSVSLTTTPTATQSVPLAPTLAGPPLSGRIAFPVWNGSAGRYDTYLAQASDGSSRHLVAADVHQPAFSPDGSWLAVNSEQEARQNLAIVRPDGSDLREVTEHIEDALPVWSPDGKGLVFSSTRHGDRQSRVYVIDAVPLDNSRAPGRSLNAGPDDVRGGDPTWTGSGQIVYTGCDHTAAPVVCGLLRMPAEPGAHSPVPLTAYPGDIAPAANGEQIAFMSDREGNWEVYVVNLDGSGLQRLTNSVANDGLPAWSPDGRTIAFVSDLGAVWAVWAIDADGSNRRKLFDLGGQGLAVDWQNQQISWGP